MYFNFIRPILETSTRNHPDRALFSVALAFGYQRAGDLPRAKESPGPAGAAGEDLFGAAVHLHQSPAEGYPCTRDSP